MNNMNKKADLCRQLNMNFEEANELFEEESLGSLQMAKVNGGFTIDEVLGIINTVIDGVIDGAEIAYKFICGTTMDPGENHRNREKDKMFVRVLSYEMAQSGGGSFVKDTLINETVS